MVERKEYLEQLIGWKEEQVMALLQKEIEMEI